MKNLYSQLTFLKDDKTPQKRDFILKTIRDYIVNTVEKVAFIDNLGIPLGAYIIDDEMNDLLNGLAGYHIYLRTHEPLTGECDFVRDSMHDIKGYLEGGINNGFSPRTRNYKCYLK